MILPNLILPQRLTGRIALGLMLAMLSGTAVASEIRCRFERTDTCHPHTGCEQSTTSPVQIVVRTDAKLYGRCDSGRECGWYPYTGQISGQYLNISFAVGIQGAKISLDLSHIVETSSLLGVIFVSFGTCSP